MRSFLKKWSRTPAPARPATVRRPRKSYLDIEALETRLAPVVGFNAIPPIVAPGTGFDGVVRIDGAISSPGVCTGSLLRTGQHILTAAHCVDANGDKVADRLDTDPTKVVFEMPGTFGFNAVSYKVPRANVTIHPGWQGSANVHAGNDLAILRLPTLAPSGSGGAERYEIQQAADEIGRVFKVVGYGLIGVGATGSEEDTSGIKHAGLNVFSMDATALRNEVQAVLPGPFAVGSFQLRFNGQTTAAISVNASALQVRSALEALSNIGVGDVDVHGGPALNSPWFVTFQGALGNTNVSQMSTLGNFFVTVQTRLQGAVQTSGSNALVYDFDNGQVRQNILCLYYGRCNDVALGANEAMASNGDSGGPALIGNRIAGVVSHSPGVGSGLPDVDNVIQNETFGEMQVLMRVSAYASWINTQLSLPRAVVLDMQQQLAGTDDVADTIVVSRSGADLRIFINGVLAQTVPVAQVNELSILGSADAEQITVDVGFAVPVTVNSRGGADTLVVQGTADADNVIVSSVQVANLKLGLWPAAYSNVENLTVLTVGGADIVNLFSGVTVPTTVNTGAGADTIILAAGSKATVDGGSDADTLQGSTFGNHIWLITGANAGTLDDTASFSNVENLMGGNSPDLFAFQDGGRVAGTINGHVGGGDMLDYTGRTTGVVVDLMFGVATGVGGDVFNIEDVVGTQDNDLIRGNFVDNRLFGAGGNDVLVGMEGNDLLFASGNGRSLLIGGFGADTLSGGAEEDILLGGFTDFDVDNQTLSGILAQWVRTDLDYQQRIALFRGDGSETATGQLNAATVHDDSAADQLSGGTGLDWFWAFGADVINGLEAGEQVN